MLEGCRITLQVRVLEMEMRVLREFDGFTFISTGKDRWVTSYDEDV